MMSVVVEPMSISSASGLQRGDQRVRWRESLPTQRTAGSLLRRPTDAESFEAHENTRDGPKALASRRRRANARRLRGSEKSRISSAVIVTAWTVGAGDQLAASSKAASSGRCPCHSGQAIWRTAMTLAIFDARHLEMRAADVVSDRDCSYAPSLRHSARP